MIGKIVIEGNHIDWHLSDEFEELNLYWMDRDNVEHKFTLKLKLFPRDNAEELRVIIGKRIIAIQEKDGYTLLPIKEDEE